MKKHYLIPAVLILLSIRLSAGGFQINEHGARAMAMGGAFTAISNDLSTLFYNPAGLTQLYGTQFSAGVTLIKPNAGFRGPNPEITEYKVKEKYFNPINFYISHQISDNLVAGLGINNPYGLGTFWDENWVGKYLAIDTEIRTFFFTPSVAYKISDNLSLGVGFVFAYGDVLIARKTPTPFNSDALISMEGDGTGYGFTAGVLYKPLKNLSLGLSYRSEVSIEFTGEAVATGHPELINNNLLPAGNITAPLSTPMNLTVGAAYMPSSDLTITADYQYIGWSSYDVLEVTFDNYTFDDGTKKTSSVRDYENTYIARLGAEYNLNSTFSLRGGFLYDNNPVKDEKVDPTLPDADRLGFSAGFGYCLTDNFRLDLAYLYLRFAERKITNSAENYIPDTVTPFNGVYNSDAHLFGLSLSYKM